MLTGQNLILVPKLPEATYFFNKKDWSLSTNHHKKEEILPIVSNSQNMQNIVHKGTPAIKGLRAKFLAEYTHFKVNGVRQQRNFFSIPKGYRYDLSLQYQLIFQAQQSWIPHHTGRK